MRDELEPTGEGFRGRLFAAESISPERREAYRKELESLLYETHTTRSRLLAITILLICLGVIAGEIDAVVRSHAAGPSCYIGAITMLFASLVAVAWSGRDLLRGRSVRRRSLK